MRARPLLAALVLTLSAALALPVTAPVAVAASAADGLLTAAFADGQLVLTPPAEVVAVDASGVLHTSLVATADVADGASLSPLTLGLDEVTGPGTATLRADASAVLSAAGDTIEVASSATTPVDLTFSAPGSYSLTLAARVQVDQSPTDQTSGTSTQVTATAVTVQLVVAEAAAATDDTASGTAQASTTEGTVTEGSPTEPGTTEPGTEQLAADMFVPATATSAATTSDGRTVFSTGRVGLTPLITDETHVQLGLVDQTTSLRDATQQTFYEPDQVVLHLPNQDAAYPGGTYPASDIYRSFTKVYDPSAHYWSTPAGVPSDADGNPDYTTIADRLLLSMYAGANYHKKLGSGFNAAFRNDISGAFTYSLADVEGPGDVVAYQQPSAAWPLTDGKDPLWTTAAHTATTDVSKSSAGGDPLGTTFTQTGVYCLTAGVTIPFSSGTTTTDTSTYTVVVGELPATVPVCAQPGSTDPTDPDPTDPEQPSVLQYDSGHLDVRAGVKDGDLTLGVDSGLVPLSRVVLSGTQEGVVPAQVDGVSSAFFGDTGRPYWYFPLFVSGEVDEQGRRPTWPGFSTESIDAAQVSSSITFTLTGADGPGDVALWSGTSTYDPMFSTRLGLPMSYEFGTNAHYHSTWAFTEQGVYCLALTARAQLADGHWSTTSGQLTVVVGTQTDPTTVTPCERTGDAAPVQETRTAPHDLVDGAAVYEDGYLQADVFLGADGLDVAAAHRDTMAGSTQYRDLDDTIVSTTYSTNGLWTVRSARAGANPSFSLTTTSLPTSALASPGVTRVSLGEVTGPGEMTVDLTGAPSLGTADGASTQYLVAQQSTTRSWQWGFGAAGIYCVPLTFTVPTSQGTDASVTKVLTVVAGTQQQFPRDQVVPCADGGQATAPGGDDVDPQDPQDPQWDVANGSLTDSGAVILNDGHVDVASLLDGGDLTTRVKDTTASATPVWRDPASTVLQLLPDSQTTVPDSTTYRFLGSAGSRVWQVTETQQQGLLWPGWSTEAIPAAATVGGVTWSLTDVSGPGEFALYTSDPTSLGAVDVQFSTRDGITAADSFMIDKSTHAHGSWAFSAQGLYCLAFTRSATLSSGAGASDSFVLAVAVGEVDVTAVNPAGCFTTPAGRPTATDAAPVPDSALTSSSTGPVQVVDAAAGFTPGQLVSIRVGTAYAGQWVSVWLHSTPTWLGWAQVDATGLVRVRLPAGAATGSHRLVVKTADGALLGWSGIELVAAPAAAGSTQILAADGTPAAQEVAATQCVSGATILSAGHVDYASRIVDGQLESLIGDDTAGTKVYREPAGVVLWLKPSSRVTLPAGYAQVGAAGSSVWQVPQSQNPALIWLGWNTEALNAGNATGAVSWTLTDVAGPGTVKVYLSGAFGGVQQMVLNGAGSSYDIPLGVHAHASWAFSAQGIYRLRMTQTVTLANGQRSADTETVTIAVGDVDPASAITGSGSDCGTASPALLLTKDTVAVLQAAEQAGAGAAVTGRTSAPDARTDEADRFTNPFTALAQGNPVPLLLTVLGGLLLTGAAGGGVLWWRRRAAAVVPATRG